MGEVSVGERNLLGLGLYAKAAVQYGQHAQWLSALVRGALSARLSGGVGPRSVAEGAAIHAVHVLSNQHHRWCHALRLCLARGVSLQLRYSLFSQKVTLPAQLQNCMNNPLTPPDFVNTFPTPDKVDGSFTPPPGTTSVRLLRGRRGLAGGAARARQRRRAHLDGRLRPELQHAGQQSVIRPAVSSRFCGRTSPAPAATSAICARRPM